MFITPRDLAGTHLDTLMRLSRNPESADELEVETVDYRYMGSLGATPSTWESQTQSVQQAMAAGDMVGLAKAAIALSVAAKTVFPVSSASDSIAAAAAASINKTTTTAGATDLKALVTNLVAAAQTDDAAADVDRIENENGINRQIDLLNQNIQAFIAANSGFMAIWDRIKGGADMSALTSQVSDIQALIDTLPLTVAGRGRVNARLKQVAGTIKLGDWKLVAAGAAGLLLWKLASGKAAALAGEHAARVSKRVGKHVKKKLGIKTSKKKKK